MVKQAEWNDIEWGPTSGQLATISSLKISRAIKTEEKESSKGGNKTIVKSLEAEQLSVTYNASFAGGLDPRGEFDMLKKCAGMQDYFILNGTKISQQTFELEEINLANTVLNNDGRILAGELTLNFATESAPSTKGGKGTKGKKKNGSKKAKKSSLTLAPNIAKG